MTGARGVGPPRERQPDAQGRNAGEAHSSLFVGAADDAHQERAGLFEWRKEIAASELSSTRKLIAWTLSLHMDRDGDSCFPSQARVAREASLSERAVRDG